MLPTEGPAAAKAAGLRYTTDAIPGIRRVKRGKHFTFIAADGKPLTDKGEIARIKSLAIPPAYTDVWICPQANGHLQATGRDARGRKQYRYHKRWREVRDETKFDRMIEFAKALPSIRAGVARDIALTGMPREKVLATIVSLMERTAIRVGNEEYARENDSYGLTTLREEHVDVKGSTVRFHFRGKSGKEHDVEIRDKRIARIIQKSQDLPGQQLFEYLDDDGAARPVRSEDVNDYLKEISGGDFTAKDFRTWEATMMCALELAALEAQEHNQTERKKLVTDVIKKVSEHLGNTPAVCKKSYVYPGVVDQFLSNGALELIEKAVEKASPHALDRHETAVVALIERIVTRENQPLADVLAKSVRAERAKRKKPAKRTAAAKKAA
ncbi:MAG: topoisomerase [Candidatus Eremiobacteraeota bacterium]|jgi:DNA topoisomerase-1|nr:topoisomerase [Candidatus Eremiobacteraeota bacterium]